MKHKFDHQVGPHFETFINTHVETNSHTCLSMDSKTRDVLRVSTISVVFAPVYSSTSSISIVISNFIRDIIDEE